VCAATDEAGKSAGATAPAAVLSEAGGSGGKLGRQARSALGGGFHLRLECEPAAAEDLHPGGSFSPGKTLALESGHSLPARRVVEILERLRLAGRCPGELRMDNGPEFVSKSLLRWCHRHHVILTHIQPGKPTQYGHVESFNGKLRDECLDTHVFWNLVDAQINLK
jgi:hypothetical protein